ncbi:MAG: type II secretion system protein [Verrucomicrobiota bacterium]
MKRKKVQGFTLIELLVATGVTAIIVGLMITMVSNLLTAYNRSSGALSAQSQARFVLDQIATEVESMVLRSSTDVMLGATIRGNPSGYQWTRSDKPSGGDSLSIPPVGVGDRFNELDPIEDLRFNQGGVFLTFFSAAPTLANDVDTGVRAIGYRMEFDSVTNLGTEPYQYLLYRVEIPARDTFDLGYDLYDSGSFVGPPDLLSPDENDIIASNVVDFGVRFYEISDDTLTRGQRGLLFPLNQGEDEYFAAGSGAQAYPNVIEVMIRILTPEGVRLLRALRDDNLTGTEWWGIVVENSEVYSRVINIPSEVL